LILCFYTTSAGWSLWPPLEGEGTGVDRWPLRKFPLLVDSERNIVESSIIIEYLQLVASRASASAGAEIRTSPDFGVIRLRLPTPSVTSVRRRPRRCTQHAELNKTLQSPSKRAPGTGASMTLNGDRMKRRFNSR
jgi:hypothetical protein